MDSSIFQVIALLIICGAVSWGSSKFIQLPVDVFNAANGLLLAFIFGFDKYIIKAIDKSIDVSYYPDTVSYIALLFCTQLAIGILIINSNIAFKNSRNNNSYITAYKSSAFYTMSLVFSILAYYGASILYLHQNDIFGPLETNVGEILVTIRLFLDNQSLDLGTIILLSGLIFFICLIRIKLHAGRVDTETMEIDMPDEPNEPETENITE